MRTTTAWPSFRDSRIAKRLAPWLALSPLALLAAASLAWGGAHGLASSADLMRRVDEVVLVLGRVDPYQDPDMTYPPTAPAVFVPLIAPLVGWPIGLRAFWLVLNLGSAGVIGALIVRTVGARWPSWVACAFVLAIAASKPTRLGIGMGQFALLPLALVLAAHEASRRGKSVVAGLMLGIALVKPTMVLPFLVVFAVRGSTRALGVAAGVQTLALLAVSGWLGLAPGQLIREWLALAAGQNAAGLIDAPSVLARYWPGMSWSASWISLAVLGFGSAWIVAFRHAADRWLLAFAGFVAAVMVYHRPYDLVLLIPAAAVLVDAACRAAESPRARFVWGAIAVAFGALLVAPAHPSIVAEATYDALFIPAAYAFLGLVTIGVAVESRRTNRRDEPRAHPEPRPNGAVPLPGTL